jgi:hypothetical protein
VTCRRASYFPYPKAILLWRFARVESVLALMSIRDAGFSIPTCPRDDAEG